MFLSVFDIFKIGIGPSSSHTMGPMVAARMFLDDVRGGREPIPGATTPVHLQCSLHGSLAFTGKGHATDKAVCLGLLGETPDTLEPDQVDGLIAELAQSLCLRHDGLPELRFDPETDIIFDYDVPLAGHPNGLAFHAFDADGRPYMRSVFYSVGGGFVVREEDLQRSDAISAVLSPESTVPYPFHNAAEMLDMAARSGKSIAEMKRANENARSSPADDPLDARIDRIINAMFACIDRGLNQEGVLPGGLNVRRRARKLHEQLQNERGTNLQQPHVVNDWLSVYAMAVNEENAAGGRVVTSPTNGAAGVVPATLRYYRDHCIGSSRDGERIFILTAAAIGGLIKHNASISGAEVGCQGEVGSASAMAAAGICAALGGSPEQIENAAEIALEHHLGMTCDPVGGLVQVPCIERNGLGAIKAVSAASLALRGDGQHFMPLDNCIEAMRQTGRDMSDKYKETSTGGLAVNLPEC